MFSRFLSCMSNFMSIRYYLLLDFAPCLIRLYYFLSFLTKKKYLPLFRDGFKIHLVSFLLIKKSLAINLAIAYGYKSY